MDDMPKLRIEYDDDLMTVLDKINRALKARNLVFVDDGLEHDGYCLFTLETKEEANEQS